MFFHPAEKVKQGWKNWEHAPLHETVNRSTSFDKSHHPHPPGFLVGRGAGGREITGSSELHSYFARVPRGAESSGSKGVGLVIQMSQVLPWNNRTGALFAGVEDNNWLSMSWTYRSKVWLAVFSPREFQWLFLAHRERSFYTCPNWIVKNICVDKIKNRLLV